MNKKLLFVLLIGLTMHKYSYSQVGIGTTTPKGALDVSSSTTGVLVPNVALTTRAAAAPVTNPAGGALANGTLVWNTATTALGTTNDVTPGFYYWDGTVWVSLAGNNSKDWSTTGNYSTTAGTNFLGTKDAIDFRIKTNNTDRWNISNANSGQLQSYSLGTAALPVYSFQTDTNTGLFSSSADNIGLTTNGVEGFRLRQNSNVSIGATYASTNAAPTNGLRVQGNTVIGKASGEDSRDIFSSHNSATAFSNVTGYPNSTASRAISGYADGNGIGVFGFSNRAGYGIVGLTQAGTISSFVQSGEGVVGQADGSTGVTTIPISIHGIIDETTSGLLKATPILGENNNITIGNGFGGAYNPTDQAVSAIYGDLATRVSPSSTNAYQFGVIGDVLMLGVSNAPDATGGVLGTDASGDFGILGYKSKNGTFYSVYGGNSAGSILASNTGRFSNSENANNTIGLGINGGFMGGYIKGSAYGLVSKGEEFGMYVQGKTITNEPIIQLNKNEESQRTISYSTSSTNVDITTRGTGKLINGSCYVSFKESFKNLISEKETVNITITPTAETNGVFISKITHDGFYVKENLNGVSNASFNWVAIGTRKGYENGVEISSTILSNTFDKNMNGVMNNDGNQDEGTPIYFDGNNIKFERMPDGLIKSNNKIPNKK